MKSGYKQTEVGVTPEDWEVKSVGDVCKLINGRGFKPYEWKSTGLPIIRIQNLNGSKDFNYFDGLYAKKLEVESGQLLFAWSGSRGTSFGPHIWKGPIGLLNYHTWKVQIYESQICKDFFLYALKQLTKYIEDRAHGASALVHTQKWEMEAFKFPMPASAAEQHAIADALSDVEVLLGALDRLIAKKRDLKQAAIQQLLTGQTRLPGYHGEWKVKRLDQLAEIRSGGTPSTTVAHFWDGDIPWCTPTDITSLGGRKYLSGTTRLITKLGLNSSSAEMIPARSIIMTSRATIGECAINQIAVSTNQGFKNFVPNETTDVEFLYYLLTTQKAQFVGLCGGSTFLEIGKAQLTVFQVRLPNDKDEQIAISTILSDMDDEINALEQRRNKTRAIKQGMMQELLTGKTRLVDPIQAKAAEC
ncbi:restriction endonuclease subunit S [Seongchinamella unica]|uniref:Restriction endonuclease subunit S n=1 Tax=Seongchinamella unica TaxID=2547392 RepID=A0A4R5LVZ8_9GAMM|nr:restriction endonuclease subunit S [Seongchinamella unica]TDG15636.1 restriction endonuclease subunit S [Seongchinamella unica]